MQFKTSFSALALSLISLLGGTQVNAQSPTRPTIPLLDVKNVTTDCDQTIVEFKHKIQQFENIPLAEAQSTWFTTWNQFAATVEDFTSPISILSNVSTDAKVRQYADECLVKYSAFSTDLYQNEKIYALFKAVTAQDSIDAKLKKDILIRFEDTGINFSAEKKAELKKILEQLTLLTQEFNKNIRENKSKVEFSAAELKGLPASYIANLEKNATGHYLLGFGYPEYYPFMQLADNDTARKKYYYEFTRRGTEKNLLLLKQITDLRADLAKLFGYASYADFAIKDRMAKDPATVNKFLADIKNIVTPLEKQDLAQLQAFKAKTLSIPLADAKIEAWSSSYWSEKYRKANYQVDQEELRKYFPTEAAQKWLIDITSQLYGVRFEQANIPVWHKEVRYFNVYDTNTQQFLGGLYIDPFPRDGKYGHAAVWPIYSSSTAIQRTPIAVLVTNFNRKGLNADELETFVHEFGHAMHNILSKTRYVDQAGTSVEQDFVEAPSQMYEEWAKNDQSLLQLSKYCAPGCPKLTPTLNKKINAARNYGRSIRYARQTLYAQYDMSIHAADAKQKDPLKVWQDMEGQTALGYVPGTEFPGQFNHLVGGYGAGYYSYLWAEVIALDLLSAYKDNLMDKTVGQAYRQEILSQGSQKPATELIQNFLHRPANNQAFLKEISGQSSK